MAEVERDIDSAEATEWLAVFMLEHEEMEAARSGGPSPSRGTPARELSPDAFFRTLDQWWPPSEN